MVRVITIMDDVYVELNRLKKSRNMSFSQAIRFLLSEKRDTERQIKVFAGSISDDDIDRKAVMKVSKVF